MKTPAKDGMDPKALKKAIVTEGELIPEQQLNEDLAVTGAPPKTRRNEQGRA